MNEPVLLNWRQMTAAWNARRHSYVRMCAFEVRKRLMSGRGVVARRNGEPVDATARMHTYLNTYMVPFSNDALEALWAFGVVPIAEGKAEGAGMGPDERVAYVPRFGTYAISTWAERGLQQFGFHWLNADGQYAAAAAAGGCALVGEPDPRVFVAHDFGYDPDLSGQLNSLLYSVASQLNLVGAAAPLPRLRCGAAAPPPRLRASRASAFYCPPFTARFPLPAFHCRRRRRRVCDCLTQGGAGAARPRTRLRS